jgi:predicted HAD superfamily hydrolase
MIKLASFDIFDTCLSRKCGSPSTIFYLLGSRLLSELQLPVDSCAVEDFVAARIQAELWCRQHTDSEEVTLAAIWKRLREILGWVDENNFEEHELEIERVNFYSVGMALDLVQKARLRNERIAFISDTYFPAYFIKQELIRHGIFQPGDHIYCSSEIGKTKNTGNLFAHVLLNEEVRGSEMMHCGDNVHSDIIQARRHGIKVRFFDQTLPSPAEEAILSASSADAQVARRLAGVMRFFRTLQSKSNTSALIGQFHGPFTVTFAAWVLSQAQQVGIKRLYFVSRDCQLTLRVAKKLSDQFGGIDCRYLQVSRQALCLPSITDVSESQMPWMHRSFEIHSIRRLLAKIELSVEEIFEAIPQSWKYGADYVLKNTEDWNTFWRILNKEPHRTRILALAEKRRLAAIAYFQDAGLFEPVPWAIVDLGWFLSGQEAIGNILRTAGWSGQITGFYLSLDLTRQLPFSAGKSFAMFYGTVPEAFTSQAEIAAAENVTLLEHIVGISNHPSVHRYEFMADGTAGPHYRSNQSIPSLDLFNNLASQLETFASECITFARELGRSSAAGNMINCLVKQLVMNPSPDLIAPLINLSLNTDQNNMDETRLIRPLCWADILVLMLPASYVSKMKRKKQLYIWPAASLVASSKVIRQIQPVAKRLGQGLRIASKCWRKTYRWFFNTDHLSPPALN